MTWECERAGWQKMSKDGRTLETSGTKLSKGEKTQAYAVCAVYPEAHAYVT